VDLNNEPQPLEEILAYYARGQEDGRLDQDTGNLERFRTQELLLRNLPAPPAVVLDVGGGTGRYATWLAARGYTVHLVDPVPLHVEQARARSAAQPHAPLASVSAGDARRLDWSADQVDAVLLLGPLYHLTERSDRIRALTEARRVLRPNGVVLDRGTEDAFFTTAYLHRPDALQSELTEAGFGQTCVLAIEGPAWLLQDLDRQWDDPMLREILLEVVRRTEAEPSLLGASSHLLAVGRKIA
jgi:ubiquinone/menaquinone biosynthesis C-methylase UbiE